MFGNPETQQGHCIQGTGCSLNEGSLAKAANGNPALVPLTKPSAHGDLPAQREGGGAPFIIFTKAVGPTLAMFPATM